MAYLFRKRFSASARPCHFSGRGASDFVRICTVQSPFRASIVVQHSGMEPSAHCDISLVQFLWKAQLDCLITSISSGQIVGATMHAA